jgi:hypothetical protein
MNIIKALFLDELIEFFDFWFHHLPKRIIRNYFDTVYSFEGNLKFRTNLRNIFKPLYGDYTIIGRIISFTYRIIKIIFALFFYLFLALIYLIILIFTLLLPFFFLIYGNILSK